MKLCGSGSTKVLITVPIWIRIYRYNTASMCDMSGCAVSTLHSGSRGLRPCLPPFSPVLRSRHFFARLRLAEVPEPTQAPTYLGWLRLQAKEGGSGSMH